MWQLYTDECNKKMKPAVKLAKYRQVFREEFNLSFLNQARTSAPSEISMETAKGMVQLIQKQNINIKHTRTEK